MGDVSAVIPTERQQWQPRCYRSKSSWSFDRQQEVCIRELCHLPSIYIYLQIFGLMNTRNSFWLLVDSDYQNSLAKANGVRILGALLSKLHPSFVDASLHAAVQVISKHCILVIIMIFTSILKHPTCNSCHVSFFPASPRNSLSIHPPQQLIFSSRRIWIWYLDQKHQFVCENPGRPPSSINR